jgi:hypothetical protein
MREDTRSGGPAQATGPTDHFFEEPTEAAVLKIFLMPTADQGGRGWIAAFAARLRRGAYRTRPWARPRAGR